MKFYFNLQMFNNEQNAEEVKVEIPSELDGVDEDVAREIMEQVQVDESKPEKEPTEITDEGNQEQVTSAEADSDNKQVEQNPASEESQQNIPYKRFKEINDKYKAKDAENLALKEQLAKLQSQQNTHQAQIQQPAFADNQQVQTTHTSNNPLLNADVLKRINESAVNEAMKITGLTKEELEGVDYADKNDPRFQTFKTAVDISRQQIISQLNNEMQVHQQRQQQFIEKHKQVLNDYATFEQQEAQLEDFEQIKTYATCDFFAKLNPVDQQTVSDAYARIQNQTCSPQDVFIVKKYYSAAAKEFRKNQNELNQNQIPQQTAEQKKEKFKQMEKHPRVDMVSGSNSDEGLTVDSLERMLKEKDWDDIPSDVQKLLLGN